MMNWIRTLLGLGHDTLPDGGMLSFRFATAMAGWLAFGVVAVALAMTWLVYRRDKSYASRPYLVLLGAMRMLAIGVVLFAILRPILTAELEQKRTATLPVLVDRSLSMGLTDRYPPERASRLASLLPVPEGGPQPDVDKIPRLKLLTDIVDSTAVSFWSRLDQLGHIKVFAFSDDVRPLDAPLAPAPTPAGATTRLGDALRTVTANLRGQRIAALLLFSDGRSNAGLDPETATRLYALQREDPFPIVCVGVGSPEPRKDISVVDVLANERVLASDALVVQALIRQTGFDDEPVIVQVTEEGRIVGQETVELAHGSQPQAVTIPLEKQPPGAHRFVCHVVPKQGEDSAENNSYAFSVEVIDRKVRLLLVAGEASWEYRYLKNMLFRSPSIELTCWLQSAERDFPQEGNAPIDSYPETREQLLHYDVVILCAADLRRLSAEQINDLASLVELGGGLVYIAGASDHGEAARGLERALPVVLNDPSDAIAPAATTVYEKPFAVELTAAGRSHALTRLDDDEATSVDAWQRLPDFYWYQPVERVKPGAIVLAEHPFDRLGDGRQPLIAVQFFGEGRTLYVGSPSTWRWRYEIGEKSFSRFWGQAVRFLTSTRLLGGDAEGGTGSRRFFVATDRLKYAVGDSVECYARCLAEDYSPLRRDEVLATIEAIDREKAENREVRLVASAQAPGLFRGSFSVGEAGRYRVQLSDPASDSKSVASSSFEAQMPVLEYDELSADHATLRKMAEVSGGAFFELEDVGPALEAVAQYRQSVTARKAIDLWDTPLVMLALVTFLTAEWLLRRRKLLP